MVCRPLLIDSTTDTPLDIDERLPDIFSIPDLLIGPSETLPPPSPSTALKDASELPEETHEVEDDVWLLPEGLLESAKYQSWDSFDDQKNRDG